MAYRPLTVPVPTSPAPHPEPREPRPPRPSAPPARPLNRGVVAGSLIVGAMLGCGGAGLGIGALLGVSAIVGLAGLFAGFVVGLILVFNRFRDL
jgi:predicted lipid-binding transport protein (Tim44 family)